MPNEFELTRKLEEHALSQGTYRGPLTQHTMMGDRVEDAPTLEDPEKESRKLKRRERRERKLQKLQELHELAQFSMT